MRPVSRALQAVCYLTIVPLAGRRPGAADDLGAAAPWFPVVGTALGTLLALVDVLSIRIFPPLLAALVTLTMWKLLTGGLHLDGLADCLDGLAGGDPAERQAIMRDSRIGAFGAIGLVLFLMLELAALTELPATARWRALLAAPTVGRATPALLGRVFAAARGAGQGARFCASLTRTAVPAALGVALLVAAAALRWAGLVAFGAGIAAALVVGVFFARRLGGITGDVLGAAVEVAELAVLLAVSAWTYARP